MSTFKISDSFFYKLAYFYIGLPFLIFILGWLQYYIAIPILVIFLSSIYYSISAYLPDNNIVDKILAKPNTLFIVVGLILIYIAFSGIGGYSFQNEDHRYRNAIFQDLVKYDWPVIYDIKGFAADNPLEGKQSLLAYYLGYWLPSAIFGKLFGLQIGNLALYFWTVLGIVLVFYYLCQYFNRYSLKVFWLFVAWGSLYFIGSFCTFPVKDILKGDAYLWAKNMLFADGNTGLIYWTFNQTITPWIIILLIINKFNVKNSIFLVSLLFFSGPFAFIGFLPFIGFYLFENIALSKDIYKSIYKYFSFQNTLGAFVVLSITYLYFKTNSSGNVFHITAPDFYTYLIFIFLSIGIIFILLFDQFKNQKKYYLVLIILLILPFIQLGFGIDLTARASIPAMFILMLLVGKYLIISKKNSRRQAIILYLLIAGFGHNLQLVRSIYFTGLQAISQTDLGPVLAESRNKIIKNIGDRLIANKEKNITIKNDLITLKNPNNVLVRNFMGPADTSFFYKYLAKKH